MTELPKTQHIVELLLRLSLLVLIGVVCFFILQPFLIVLFWSGIFAISLFPVYEWIQIKMKWKNAFSAVMVSGIVFILFFIPCYLFIGLVMEELHLVKDLMSDGKVHLPMPESSLKSWPIVGNRLFELWTNIAQDMPGFIEKYSGGIEKVASFILKLTLDLTLGVLFLFGSIILSGVFLNYHLPIVNASRKFMIKLAPVEADSILSIISKTILKVIKGVLGVAVIQTILMSICLVVLGIPGAGIWSMIILVSAVLQVGVLPACIPLVLYLIASGDSVTGAVVGICALVVGILEHVLKPLLLGGKSSDIPTMVVFIGVLGGFIAFGFLGLFVGAIIFSIMYQLFVTWIHADEKNDLTNELPPTV
ncbi:MAG: AI-2E family transporter [Cytophagaceae bacterium]|jgi:predicted PurR-regulated permease PerM|nr:AI-2E family transporter [Cytophagaceae bacterium]